MTIVIKKKTKSVKSFQNTELLKGTAAKLAKLVEEGIANEPYEYDGFLWLAAHQEILAEHLGVVRETINRIIKKSPFRYLVICLEENKRLTLIRIGDEQCLIDRQRILHSVWNEEIIRHNAAWRDLITGQVETLQNCNAQLQVQMKYHLPAHKKQALLEELEVNKEKIEKLAEKLKKGAEGAEKISSLEAAKKAGKIFPKKMLSKKDYGCLRGLAEDWKQFAPSILRRTLTIDGWANFMTAVKTHIDDAGGEYRYYDFPSIPVIRRFWFIALEVLIYDLQLSGEMTVDVSNAFIPLLHKIKLADAEKLTKKYAKAMAA